VKGLLDVRNISDNKSNYDGFRPKLLFFIQLLGKHKSVTKNEIVPKVVSYGLGLICSKTRSILGRNKMVLLIHSF